MRPDRTFIPLGRPLEGSRAVAETVARCRPQVVPAYPISPQTHIVEGISSLIRSGELEHCEFVTVESEFGAMSLCIGASATGSRTYTATSSQGLLFMAEALYNAAGLGLPIVMTVANRALGAPINIWNDQSDSLSQRDSGWIQLYARDNQAACDLHPIAFRLAEELSVPVMVCMDGFILTHAVERLDVPEPGVVDEYLPPYAPCQVLDPDAPLSIGAMVGPEAFTEVRYLAHHRMEAAIQRFPELAGRYAKLVGRRAEDLARGYRLEGARTVFVAMGSVVGTLEDAIDEAREQGLSVGAVELTCFRPFPAARLRDLLADAEHIVVLERALSTGLGGILTAELAAARAGEGRQRTTVVAGLGGRPVTRKALRTLIADAMARRLPPLSFLDLDHTLLRRAHTKENGR
ncbi:MAG TPA: transketolase C-terminal domain-containing protein [Actinospica sp.]|jgi:pyruvate ferredoxin oxidoreductase alpha subunit|nr:transketolase C-terminal domain-containing protein [Actinospica sp.]